jgi:hypothetical protein
MAKHSVGILTAQWSSVDSINEWWKSVALVPQGHDRSQGCWSDEKFAFLIALNFLRGNGFLWLPISTDHDIIVTMAQVLWMDDISEFSQNDVGSYSVLHDESSAVNFSWTMHGMRSTHFDDVSDSFCPMDVESYLLW